jgi:hypothetical protein
MNNTQHNLVSEAGFSPPTTGLELSNRALKGLSQLMPRSRIATGRNWTHHLPIRTSICTCTPTQ